jgi:hypothetical protein
LKLRVAKKIYKASRRPGGMRYSRDQHRRACLRVFVSPLQVTTRNDVDVRRWPREWGGRALIISPRLAVYEQRARRRLVRREDLATIFGDAD